MNHGVVGKIGDNMRIFLTSYQTVMLNKSGPTYKLIHTKKALSNEGIEVLFYDMWDHDLQIKEDDLFHIFNASVSTYSLAKNLLRFGAKYVVNPIFFSNHKSGTLKIYRELEKPFLKIFKRSSSDYEFTKYVCKNSDMVLPNTLKEEELLVNGLNVDRNKTKVIHNGVEKRFLNGDPSLFEKKYGVRDFVLYVGHLGSYRKNGLKMIQALKKIEVPVFIIANVFKGSEGNKCIREIENSKNITLIEWMGHYDKMLESAYAACETFILPSKYETPGRAALEAGLAGANIVITPHGGTKEYFGSMVEYVEPDSVNSIIKGIEKSLNKDKTSDLREHIKQNFIWPVIAKQTINIYNKVLNR